MDDQQTSPPAAAPANGVAADHLLPAATRDGPAAEAEDHGTPAAPPATEAFGSASRESTTARSPRRKWILIIGLVVLIIAAIVGSIYYAYARQFEDTDDAFLDAHIASIAPRIDGHVIKIMVDDNQWVKQGDPMVELDPSTLDSNIAQAKANLDAAIAHRSQSMTQVNLIKKTATAAKAQAEAGVVAAQSGVATAQAGIAQAQAQLGADQAVAHKADLDLQRFKNLLQTGDVTQQQVDGAVADDATARAKVAASQTGVAAAQAQLAEARAKVLQAQGQLSEVSVVPERTAVSESEVDTDTAQIEQLQAALDLAKLTRTYATINAPIDGRVTKRNVELGNYVEKGQPLFALVPKNLYVTANFKETQLALMKANQAVEIKIDAYPDLTLHGHVDSFQEGTGARFSMIPPENATGNFVKVVQRVPVKIVFDKPLDESDYDFAPGMSVEPRVTVR